MASNDQGTFTTDDDRSTVSVDPIASAGKWLVVLAISVGIFLLTLSPLLGMVWPYLRAGWPPVRTAWWLRQNDPWPARGKVGFYFHLAMAGFRAGVVGVFMGLVMAIIFSACQNNNVVPTQFIIGICVVMAGSGLSFVCGWWGTILALRHRVRVFVISNLCERCRADFSQIERVSKLKFMVNPANYVMAVAIVTPALAIWFAAMVATMPRPGDAKESEIASLMLGCALPGLGVGSIVLLLYLSRRLIALTPHECWGAAVPSSEPSEDNWYQTPL